MRTKLRTTTNIETFDWWGEDEYRDTRFESPHSTSITARLEKLKQILENGSYLKDSDQAEYFIGRLNSWRHNLLQSEKEFVDKAEVVVKEGLEWKNT